MIKINRENVKIPQNLRTDIESDGKRETDLAIKFFKARMAARAVAEEETSVGDDDKSAKEDSDGKVKKEKSFPFSAYSSGDVKEKLKILFHNKCGFCEIDYGGAVSDIEHFRPKGRIDYMDGTVVRSYTEGYYWLASDWNNLIYSCQHCNRGETHDQVDQFEAAARARVSGKRNFFPVRDESKRLKLGGRVEDEDEIRLLLDPCKDNPRDHLEFRENGLVFAKRTDGTRSDKGLTSIDLFGLRRLSLVERRKERAENLLYAIRHLNDALEKWRANSNDAQLRKAVVDELRHIRSQFLAPQRPFLAMCRSIFLSNIDVSRIVKELHIATSTTSAQQTPAQIASGEAADTA